MVGKYQAREGFDYRADQDAQQLLSNLKQKQISMKDQLMAQQHSQ